MAVQYLPDLLRHVARPRALELGSRLVTGNRWERPPDWECVGTDIVPGPGVDLVADAHELSRHLAPESFDAVFSSAVFEHLAMPWKVVLELNAILRPGGVVWIGTHEAFPIHEWPWDFFRFGQDVWPTLFSARTGFELIGSRPLQPCRVRPVAAEHAPFLSHTGTEVQARKTGPADPALRWDVALNELLPPAHLYPASRRRWWRRARTAFGRAVRVTGIGARHASPADPWRMAAHGRRWLVARGPHARGPALAGDEVEAGPPLRAKLASIAPGTLEAVALVGALEIEPEPWRLVEALHRVLAPGGWVYLDTAQVAATLPGVPSLWRFSSEALLALFHAAAGFRLERRSMLDPCLVEDPLGPPAAGARAYLRTLGLARRTGAFDRARLSWGG